MVINGLPVTGRHPVPSLAVGLDGALFVNVGSATDNCQLSGNKIPNPKIPCPETQERPPRGSVLRFPMRRATWPAAEQAPYARGLRNSMAMALLPDGKLAVAVNSRDAINIGNPALSDATLPHDLLIVLQPGGDYGCLIATTSALPALNTRTSTAQRCWRLECCFLHIRHRWE